MNDEAYVKLVDIRKSFFGVEVLKGVTFDVYPGEVHGLLGGNGAGKSTLMNILGGLYTKDGGDIIIDGKTVSINTAHQAEQAGIGFVHQELKLFNGRNIAENIYMWRLPTTKIGFVNDKLIHKEARQYLDQVGLDIPTTMKLGDLSLAEQQLVEIAKVLSMNAKIIIFDEPTSSLTVAETKRLFGIIRQLKEAGKVIIFISHKFDEIFEICDKVTVLRDGQVVFTRYTAEITSEDLASAVIGRRLDQYYPVLPKAPGPEAEVVLEVKNYKNNRLNGVDLDLRKGEILGLFGLVGAGRSELLRAIFGLDVLETGETFLNGQKVKINNPRKAMNLGISFLTENRREEGLVLKRNIRENLTLPILKRVGIPGVGTIRFKKENQLVKEAFQKFLIKAEGPRQISGRLSGGNQQKVVLSKWMMTEAPILLLDEPTRGVDIGAKAEIYELITKMVKENGMSVILVSSEAPEIMGMSHRIAVMRGGKIAAIYQNGEVTEEHLVLAASKEDAK